MTVFGSLADETPEGKSIIELAGTKGVKADHPTEKECNSLVLQQKQEAAE